MADEKIIIKIDGDTSQIDRSLDKTDQQLKKTKKSALKLKTSMDEVKTVAVAGFGALTAATVVSIKAFAKFDNDLRGVKTLLNESSFGAKGLERGFDGMRAEMLKLGKTVPVSLESMNKSLFDAVSAGIPASKAVKAVGVAAKLATAGLTDVSIATDGITSALNAYQIGAEDAEVVASKFFAAQKAGKTTIEELSNGFGLAGASASSFGVSLDELLAAVSAVTTAGVKTNSAYTGLNALLAGIAKPTADAAKEAKRLGIEFNTTALRTKGLEKFLSELSKAQGFTQQSIEKLFGSVEAQKIAFALTGAQASTFKDLLADLGDEQKNLTQLTNAYNTQAESTENVLKILANNAEVMAITIGERLAPALNTAAKFWSDFARGGDQSKRSLEQVNEEIAKSEENIARLKELDKEFAEGTLRFGDMAEQSKLKLIDAEQELINLKEERNALELERLEEQNAAKGEIDAEAKEQELMAQAEHDANLKKLADKKAKDDEKRRKADFKKESAANLQRLNLQRMYAANSVTIADNLATISEAISGKKNKTLFYIAKAAAVAQSIIMTHLAAAQALATPPGPPTTLPLAAMAKVAGYTNTAAIIATTFTGMAKGGVVTGGIPGRDSVPTMLMPGELVVPRESFDDVVSKAGGASESQQVEVTLTMSDNLVDFVEAELAQRSALDTGV